MEWLGYSSDMLAQLALNEAGHNGGSQASWLHPLCSWSDKETKIALSFQTDLGSALYNVRSQTTHGHFRLRCGLCTCMTKVEWVILSGKGTLHPTE